jgi:Highly conserved protein containing a thioredoxin domain
MNGFAQDGVKFMEGNFQEALNVARQQKKMVFVDVYTSWCGPCRWMSEEVLQTPEAATYFDKHFVCFKIDAEKGDGVEFAKKYDVHAYPTFLMFLPDGTLQHKVVGADTLKLFIPRVERGLKERTSWKYLMEKYVKGTLQKREIPVAIQVFEEAHMKKEVKGLTDSLFQLLSPNEKLNGRYWVVYEQLKYEDLFTPRFKFLVQNRTEIAGKGRVAESFEIIRTMLFDHLINNTTGRITSKQNPWNCGEANEMPYMRSLIEMSDLPDKAFFLAWCDVASACYFGQADQVKKSINKIVTFPEAREYGRWLAWAFKHYFPEDENTYAKLRQLWALEE